MRQNQQIAVIGGGLAGLTAAFLLAKKGLQVTLIEKNSYPIHKVCGEYVSNEVKPFLQNLGLYPQEFQPTSIKKFLLTSPSGKKIQMPLDLGGFGISRYALDNFLYQKCLQAGVNFILRALVNEVEFMEKHNRFSLTLRDGSILEADYVLGAFGKRSKMDKHLERKFIETRSPFIGVKYHVKTDFPADTVALHNYQGGYLGINQVENQVFNICYLGNKQQLKETGSIPKMEEQHLYRNPEIRRLFHNSDFLLEKPVVINEVNFSKKEPVVDHILMIGDAAGLITPLCGNGMAIAIHSGKLAAEAIVENQSRIQVENQYAANWRKQFSRRLWIGRNVQKLFGSDWAANFSVNLLQRSPYLGRKIMENTHGKVI
jgi:menaquinone-9 beta-reductase